MNKIKILTYVGIAFIVVGIVVCFFEFMIGLLCAGLGACLIWVAYSYAKRAGSQNNTTDYTPVSSPETPTVTLEQSITLEGLEYDLKYAYDAVAVACADMSEYAYANEVVEIGDELNVELEPTNPYDSQAVAFTNFRGVVAYLHKGKLQSMANDYLLKGKPVIAIANDYPLKTVSLGFYALKSPEV